MPECVLDRSPGFDLRLALERVLGIPVVLLLLVLPDESAAQELEAISPEAFGEKPSVDRRRAIEHSAPADPSDSGPRVLHVTDRLWNSPAGQDALRRYQRTIADAGTAGKRVESVVYSVDDTSTFNVYRPNSDGSTYDETAYRMDVRFVLKKKSPDFYLWVEVEELTSTEEDTAHVRTEDIENLYDALENETPAGSYDAASGIIVNNEAIFGEPFDIDNNGRSHILLTDIKDDWDGGVYVAGFFNPIDLMPATSKNPGSNEGEVLYLDTHPGIYAYGDYRVSSNLEQTAAHEYQHLIHARFDGTELTFVNEGLSEWAAVVNGYPPRTAEYLSSSDEVSGYNTFFFNWSSSTADKLYDYQRAGLFTHYLAEQLGVEATGRLTRIDKNGVAGYEAGLDSAGLGWSFEELLSTFHTANLVNDRSVDSLYGYSSSSRSGVEAVPDSSYDGTALESSSDSVGVRPGGVYYVQWNDVDEFRMSLETDTTSSGSYGPDSVRTWIDAKLVLRSSDSSVQVDSVSFGSRMRTYGAEVDSMRSATLILVHKKAEVASGGPRLETAPIHFAAEWGGRATATVRVGTGELPEDLQLGVNYPNPFNPTTQIPYRLPTHSEVDLTVYDALGRKVATLVQGEQPPGRYTVNVDASSWPSGIYLYVLRAEDRVRTGKMMLLK